jgi:hypothetical protein
VRHEERGGPTRQVRGDASMQGVMQGPPQGCVETGNIGVRCGENPQGNIKSLALFRGIRRHRGNPETFCNGHDGRVHVAAVVCAEGAEKFGRFPS